MRQVARWLVGVLVLGIMGSGYVSLAAEGGAPGGGQGGQGGRGGPFGELMKQITEKETALCDKDAALKTEIEALNKQITEKRADREKMRDQAYRDEVRKIEQQKRDKLGPMDPALAELYKKMDEMRAAGRRGQAGGAPAAQPQGGGEKKAE